MIRLFKSKKILFTPTEFLNSVARWLLGVHSPTGTIRIHNTANPAEDGGASFDIDGKETYKALDPFLKADYPKVRDDALLGASMKWSGNQLCVSEEWLKNKLDDATLTSGEGGGGPYSFQLEAVKNSSGTVTGMKYYLADAANAVTVHGVAYTITGTAAGWNTLSRTGAIYLNQTAENATTLVVGASATSTARCFSMFIGSVAADGTVTQNIIGAIHVANARMGLVSPGVINGPADAGQAPSSAFNDTWTDGSYKPHGSTSTTNSVGAEITVCTGGSVDSLGLEFTLFFRTLKFDRSGRLYYIGPETKQYVIDTSN